MPLLPAIPGYAEAVARENKIREDAFLGVTESVCGIEVMPLTSELVDALQAIESPFFVGGREPNEIDVALFFWVISPHFVPGCFVVWWKPSTWLQNFRQKFARARVVKSIRKINFGAALKSIDAFICEALMDAPGGGKKRRISFISWKAAAVGTIASEYGWDAEKIHKLPLKVLWQYQREIRQRNGGTLINSFSDKIRADWLKERNAAARAAKQNQTPAAK